MVTMTSMITSKAIFNFPFPKRLSPDTATAQEESLKWARRMGLVSSENAIAKLRLWNWGLLTGHCLPQARGDDLILATQWMTCNFLYDDQFAGPLGDRPNQAVRITQQMIDSLYSPIKTLPPAVAMSDIFGRLRERMSPTWIARFKDDMKWFYIGVLRMTLHRRDINSIDFDTALRVRRLDIGMAPLVDLIEVSEGELAEGLCGLEEIQHLRQLVIDLVILENDVFSLPKDRRQKEVNVILALERKQGLTPDESLAHVASLAAERVQRFIQVKDTLPALFATLNLSTSDKTRVLDYVESLELMIHGSLHSHLDCVRYDAASEHTAPVNGVGFVQDLDMAAAVATMNSLS